MQLSIIVIHHQHNYIAIINRVINLINCIEVTLIGKTLVWLIYARRAMDWL